MYVSRSGFTLLEMAIVMVVISLLLSSFLTPIATEIDHQRIQWTQQQLEEIKRALLGFSAIYKRLPCPALNTGGGEQVIFNATTGNPQACQMTGEGFLPWVTLGVGRYDAWGNPFRYRIARQFALNANIVLSAPSNLEVQDAVGTTQLTNASDTQVAAIILSYGKNATGDGENGNSDAIYVVDTRLKYLIPGKNVPPGLDDILTWFSINTMAYYLVATKDWP